MSIDVIQPLSLLLTLRKINKDFLCYSGYQGPYKAGSIAKMVNRIVNLSSFFWTLFILDLALSYTDKV